MFVPYKILIKYYQLIILRENYYFIKILHYVQKLIIRLYFTCSCLRNALDTFPIPKVSLGLSYCPWELRIINSVISQLRY